MVGGLSFDDYIDHKNRTHLGVSDTGNFVVVVEELSYVLSFYDNQPTPDVISLTSLSQRQEYVIITRLTLDGFLSKIN